MPTISIFVNYPVLRINEVLKLELNSGFLLTPLFNNGFNIDIVAQEINYDSGGTYASYNDFNYKFSSLGLAGENKNFFSKIGIYISQVPKIWQSISNSTFCYIFYPGNIGILAIIFSLLMKKKYAIYLRGNINFGSPFFLKYLFTIFFRNASFIITTGEELSKKVHKYNPNCLPVVPMSSIILSATNVIPKIKISTTINFLFVGQIISEKGIFELLDAFEYIFTNISQDVKLVIVGDGKDRQLLEQKITQKNFLLQNIELTGRITDLDILSSYYSDASFFLLPTYHEGFPRVLYEAMYFSIPIITTSVGQIPNTIKHGVNGMLCNPKSANALIECVVQLFDNIEYRNMIGNAGRNTLDDLLFKWRNDSHGHQVLRFLVKIQ